MGIPYLTRHLLPYAESVLLNGSSLDRPQQDVPRVQAVVIDGPSLVYHVYYRLLAWMDSTQDALDIQPTCNEVSRAFVNCLVELIRRGIEIQQICFDGALPVSKRDTRLSRIEKSRHRLELTRRGVIPSTQACRKELSIRPAQLWNSRNISARWRNLPENPFMVSAVFEDLRSRWNRARILEETQYDAPSFKGSEYPWANITVMVAGEADRECARVSKLKGSTILTNDSDLLIHDLGPQGTVVLLNSMHMPGETDLSGSSIPEIRGSRLHPRELARRLDIQSLQRFAYELKLNPQLGFSELLRRSKEDISLTTHPNDYHEFLQEYEEAGDPSVMIPAGLRLQSLDPRVSELFCQYESPAIFGRDEIPHIYLGILHEDHDRRCAWEQGRAYRALGYALLKLSRSSPLQFPIVHEFVRRGSRIVAEQITLPGFKTAASDLSALQVRLNQAKSVFDPTCPSTFWVLFALSEIYRDQRNQRMIPSAAQLEQFLIKGYMGTTTDWADVHLLAQIQAVLYSLRMLRQFISLAASDGLSFPAQSVLEELPPLYLLLRSRDEFLRSFVADKDMIQHSVFQFFQSYA
ncbi:hypothetical protein N7462_001478 [Penicillium macrosclerotiorum]|uniref:uncharacterized protein n=1 Tax=Penicillium macrosclerotiorum TaxID=303699 RepID=UPI0025485864|nr:uncharacterized protein N7462_001478 [Penicillium macrosclerotiorum]KAJ5692055.1 hypothetical protein N7462_001478 [Penicillium macrosclerotiorum]